MAQGGEIRQLQTRAACDFDSGGPAQIVPQQQKKVPGAVARVQHFVRRAQGGSLTGQHAVVRTGKGGPGLGKHLHAVHNGVVHKARGQTQGPTAGRGQKQPCTGYAAGQRGGAVQLHRPRGRRQVEGRAGWLRALVCAVFLRVRGHWPGLKDHFLHQRKKVAGQAWVTAYAGRGGLP